MRTIQQTKLHRLGILYAVIGALSGVAACADSLHLDPPGVLPRADGGPESGMACTSNLECESPMALCDTVAQLCVECIVQSDCAAKPGTVCSQESCTMPEAGTDGGGFGGGGASSGSSSSGSSSSGGTSGDSGT